MNKHNCIKCGEPYQDKDPDAYLCNKCIEEKKSVASQIDSKFGSTTGQKPSGFDWGKVPRKGQGYINARDLLI